MTGCAWCVSQPPAMHPMVAQETPVAGVKRTARTALPFGFGALIGPDGVPTKPEEPDVPRPYVDPDNSEFQALIGPNGPRMFLVTFSDPSSVIMGPPDAEVEEAHVARLGELYQAGRLHFVGHQANGKEGYMLLSAKSLTDAWTLAQNDPLVGGGYFRSVDVKEIEGPYPWNRYRPGAL